MHVLVFAFASPSDRTNQFVGAFTQEEVKENAAVVIRYSAASKSTTI